MTTGLVAQTDRGRAAGLWQFASSGTLTAGVLGDVAEPAVMRSSEVTVAEIDLLFRQDETLPAVLLVGPGSPVLVERTWFGSVMTGRLGFGRLLHARRSIHDLAAPQTLVFDAETPLAHAAAEVMERREPGSVFDAVVVRHPDERLELARVGPIFERLARDYAFQSLHDPLTGLPNRLHLMELLRRLDGDAVLLYVDLDRFKEVNDQHGHAAGDQVLIEFARRVRRMLRPADVFARLGGDEFAVLTSAGMTPTASTALAERLVLEAAAPYVITLPDSTGAECQVTVSIGASVGIAHSDRPAPAAWVNSYEVLLKQADLAMYRAKAYGRGRVAQFEPGLLTEDSVAAVQSRRVMERRLRAAIAAGGLALHYQPIVELPSGRVLGAEALCRWHDSELGSVPPDQFITLAEQTGLILDLGLWVLETACREAASWPAGVTGRAPRVSVNLSAVQLAQPAIVDQVRAALNCSGLDPSRLCLEITETAAIGDLAEAADRLIELREVGIRLALDDFGSGHSSLTVLRNLPLDLVKIDRSLIERIAISAQDALLVRHVIDTAHTLGLQVCAEGIEDADQARQLSALGADSAQGWYFGMPEPASQRLVNTLSAAPSASVPSADEDGPLLASSDELILVSTADRVITYASATSRGLLGWMPRELLGTRVTDYLDPEATALIADGTVLPGLSDDGFVTHRARHSDGSYRWLESHTQFRRDSSGATQEVLTISRDVTEKVLTRRALRASETRFRHAFDEASIGMTLTGLDETFLRVNVAFAEMLGMSPDDLLSMRIADITHPDDQPAQERQTALLIEGKARRVEFTKRLLHSDGTLVPVRIRATGISDESGHRAYMLSDVTALAP